MHLLKPFLLRSYFVVCINIPRMAFETKSVDFKHLSERIPRKIAMHLPTVVTNLNGIFVPHNTLR